MSEYNHEHNHPQQKNVINRMAKIVGHAESVKRMCEEGRDCTEILIQISAVKSALNSVGKIILKDHINHCIVEAVEMDDKTKLDDLNQAIDKFVK
ncbi:MAG: metal-sensing transcriptional repressor [Acidaminobacteraceae bacterium]